MYERLLSFKNYMQLKLIQSKHDYSAAFMERTGILSIRHVGSSIMQVMILTENMSLRVGLIIDCLQANDWETGASINVF